jgi:hypothetical protein
MKRGFGVDGLVLVVIAIVFVVGVILGSTSVLLSLEFGESNGKGGGFDYVNE